MGIKIRNANKILTKDTCYKKVVTNSDDKDLTLSFITDNGLTAIEKLIKEEKKKDDFQELIKDIYSDGGDAYPSW